MWTLAFVALASALWLVLATFGQDLGPQSLQLGTTIRMAAIGVSMLAAVRLVHEVLAITLLRAKSKSGYGASDLVRSVLAVALYAIVAVIFLRFVLGMNLTGVLATSAALTVIFGLALQPMLGNVFSGVAIELERPVHIGDFVRDDKTEGRVVSLNWRSVYVQTNRGSTVVMPNSEFTARRMEVIAKDKPYRHQVDFHLGSEVPPGQVIRIAMQVICSGLPKVCLTPRPSVILVGNDAASGALRYTVRFFTLHYLDQGPIASSFLERLWYALSREGMEFPEAPTVWQAVVSGNEWEREPRVVNVDTRPNPADRMLSGGHRPRDEGIPTTFLKHVPAELAAPMLACARHIRYGPHERCDATMISFVLDGTLSEARSVSTAQSDATLAGILATLESQVGITRHGSELILREHEYQPLLQRATMALGPLASALCERIGALTEDNYYAYRAVAASITAADARKKFLSFAPTSPMRPVHPGDWFGWAFALGLETPAPSCHSGQNCHLLVWCPADLAKCLQVAEERDLDALARQLTFSAAECEATTGRDLAQWAKSIV